MEVDLKAYLFQLNDKARAYESELTATINSSSKDINIDETVLKIWLRLQEEVNSEYETDYKDKDPQRILLTQKDTFLETMKVRLANLAKALIKVSQPSCHKPIHPNP